ncbi:HAD-IA family hydrolase [Rhodoligotrophos defluvii]|uniref:HAD-IA family hydrolase n=1 Tax=Rhodoligotrophos defluvii TaxID=2561934 RepID=UPI0010C94FF0|nr:HAD-IA family hydrolase [Rhodoligotrophos defluvii]
MKDSAAQGKGSDGVVLTRRRFATVLFDLDGVVTDTARVHAAAWTQVFDAFLQERAQEDTVPFVPFTRADYQAYVDGRPRLEAIRAFLPARNLSLPEGDPSDGPDRDTVHGLGARKNRLFLDHIRAHGVDVYPSTVALIRRLRALGFKVGLVTASRNCAEIVGAARLESLFDATVDGNVQAALSLRGKPAPDAFLEAARRLRTAPARTVVIEDATAGVAAGRAGKFGLVIGVDRSGQAEALRAHGAHVVVADLSEVELRPDRPTAPRARAPRAEPDVHRLDPFISQPGMERRHAGALAETDPWVFAYDGFDPAVEGRRETLSALGNGYFVTRGAAAEAAADDIHYPGTYLAGGYNRLTTAIAGRMVEHEDLVNLPNWLPLTFRADDDDWFDLRHVEILGYRQALDLRRGLYERNIRIRDPKGRRTRVFERRFVHVQEKHLAGQHVAITAENWSGRLTVRAFLDGRVKNAGVQRYRPFNGAHLMVRDTAAPDPEIILLDAETTQSQLRITEAARIRLAVNGQVRPFDRHAIVEPTHVGQELALDLAPGDRAELEKIVALYTSRDRAVADSRTEARAAVSRAGGFEELLASHALAWAHLWRRCDMDVVELHADPLHRAHLTVRLHIFHLLQTVSRHTMELDAGVPARGWHGEGYRGHIFWDELFIFPFLSLRIPVLTRSLLLYRYRRLPEARWAARAAGYRGAMFPWQSGSNGREETDVAYLNPRSGNWIRDDTHLQRHVGAAIAYNVWRYHQATGDSEFLYSYGAELLFEIARFWASIARWNEARSRYDICDVMGPDEFHDRYPGRDVPGLDNNAYTNVMAAWCLARALDLFDLLPVERCRDLCETLDIERDEIAHWEDVSRKLYLPFHSDGILSQFEGYEGLEEFDWAAYRRRYGNIMRLDLILEAEGDSPNRYKLSKQADVLMLFYLFSAEELAELFGRLGYAFESAIIPQTIDYYLRRTSHGSTLSSIVHAWVLARSLRRQSWNLFTEALRSDIDDIQGGSTPEGIHLGAMAGTIDLLQRCYTGLELRGDKLRFHPVLPEELSRLSFQLRYRKHSLSVDLTATTLKIASDPSGAEAISVAVGRRTVVLQPGTSEVFQLSEARRPTGSSDG